MTAARLLYVFARVPEPGRSKTRLIPRLGAEGAAALGTAFCDDVCALTRDLAAPRLLAVAGDPIHHPQLVRIAAREDMALVPQAEGDLGRRMALALRDGLARAGQVCIVGSDAPTLPPAYIERAFSLLDAADVVLGPAEDGGYWLVGARRPCEAIFERIAWGTSTVLAETVERARAAGLAVARAGLHWDVDEPADLDRLVRLLSVEEDEQLAPASRAALRAMGRA